MTEQQQATCVYPHQEPQQAIGQCKDCGKPVCDDHCLTLVDGRVQCVECVKEDMKLEIY